MNGVIEDWMRASEKNPPERIIPTFSPADSHQRVKAMANGTDEVSNREKEIQKFWTDAIEISFWKWLQATYSQHWQIEHRRYIGVAGSRMNGAIPRNAENNPNRLEGGKLKLLLRHKCERRDKTGT